MSSWLYLFVVVYGIVRGLSMIVSARHEVRLRALGAVEHSVTTTRIFLAAIVLYLFGTLIEGAAEATQLDVIAVLGIALVVESWIALYLLNREMGGLWTVKVLIARTHERVRSAIYDRVRHPIYFFVLIPEWIGMGLAMHAWTVMTGGLPLLFILLGLRIQQEETALRAKFPDYRGLLVR